MRLRARVDRRRSPTSSTMGVLYLPPGRDSPGWAVGVRLTLLTLCVVLVTVLYLVWSRNLAVR